MDDDGTSTAAVGADWPRLRVADWAATRDTLHMWTQVVGKIRLAKAPMLNHWWQTPLYVTPRGLTTSSIPDGRRLFDIEMDFLDASMRIRTSDGGCRAVALEPRSVADFYAETMAALRELAVDVAIRPVPVEVPLAVPFAQDTEHASYDAAAVRLFWGSSSRPAGRSQRSAPRSSARSARCTSSGAASTSPAPGSPAGPRRRTPVACPTVRTG